MVRVAMAEEGVGISMMTRTGIRNSNKALPADIQAAFAPRTYMGMGQARLYGNAHVVQQTRSWPWVGLRGLGLGDDDGTDTVDVVDTGGDSGGLDLSNLPDSSVYNSADWTALPGTVDLTSGDSVFANMTAAQQAQFEAATPTTRTSMLASLGVPAAQIATVLNAAGNAAATALRASNGQLPINPATGLPYNYGQPTTSQSTLILIGMAAVAALFLFGRGR